jgi:MGT family glycosyltransferase
MARIMFTADLEEGNIFATFGLAKQLLARGHEVVYAGVADSEALIRNEGFAFCPLLQASYPEGSKYSTGSFMTSAESRGILCKLLVDKDGELDSLMMRFSPDVIFVPPYMALESLILQLRFGVRIVHLRSAYILNPREEAIARYCNEIFDQAHHSDKVVNFLEERGITANDSAGIVGRIAEFPEFVTLPKGYEPDEASTPNTFYIGASLDCSRREKPFDWRLVDPEKRLIFCTLGSQSHRDAERSDRFFRAVLEAVAVLDDVFLVMAVGKAISVDRYPAPSNALVADWAPQLEMLSKAQMMIMHGGMGTTRECILSNVPMLVHPMMRDQFASAEAICRHGLGLRADTEDHPVSDLRSQIGLVLKSPEIRENLFAMKEKFIASEREHLGVQIVEEFLTLSR